MYKDGVKILYFNTSGKMGGTKALSNFLKYLEESKSANVVDEAGAEKESIIADKDAAIAKKDARIAELEAQLAIIKQ